MIIALFKSAHSRGVQGHIEHTYKRPPIQHPLDII